MKMLTVKNPWAALLAIGVKPLENRSRRTTYRGDVAIVASGKRVDTGEWARKACRLYLDGADPHELPRGGIVCVVELHDVITRSRSWWFTGPVGWMVRNVRRIDPMIPRRGQQGLVSLDPETSRKVQQRLNLKP